MEETQVVKDPVDVWVAGKLTHAVTEALWKTQDALYAVHNGIYRVSELIGNLGHRVSERFCDWAERRI